MSLDTVRVYAISKLDWIKQQQKKLSGQERETKRDYLDRESHYVWGERFLLEVIEQNTPPSVELTKSHMLLRVRSGSTVEKKRAVVEGWYREQIKKAVPPLVEKWEQMLGVNVEQFYVQRMKTKWGSCNAAKSHIRLNTDLATKPPDCLEYIVAHEMVHLLEPTHNVRFVALMDKHIPQWQHCRDMLNRLPVAHEKWDY